VRAIVLTTRTFLGAHHLHRGGRGVAVEDGIDVFDNVNRGTQAGWAVLDRDEGALGALFFATWSDSITDGGSS
jgi:hypothetical protein